MGRGARTTADPQDARKAAVASALREAGIVGGAVFVKPGYHLEEVDWVEDLQPEIHHIDNSPSNDLAVVGLGLHLVMHKVWPETGQEHVEWTHRTAGTTAHSEFRTSPST